MKQQVKFKSTVLGAGMFPLSSVVTTYKYFYASFPSVYRKTRSTIRNSYVRLSRFYLRIGLLLIFRIFFSFEIYLDFKKETLLVFNEIYYNYVIVDSP